MIRPRVLAATLLLAMLAACTSVQVPPIEGTVWQVYNENNAPKGDWERLGAHRLLIQWTVVDGIAFRDGTGLPTGNAPDWKRIAGEPWAREVILGLAGRFDEKSARADIASLAETSAALARLPTPLNVVGYYFPVEIDPTWSEAPQLTALLNKLPRPLWISVYDSANVGPQELADGLLKWLPPDVGVFFQDGVGVHAREAWVARHYVTILERSLGKGRVRVIAEAFRPKVGGGFRPATIEELAPQLAAYAGLPIYLFEAPLYVTPALVDQLVKAGAGKQR
ncbi:hypothetical protein ACFPOE_00295 [Caenimonas terrae]|uniref:DUF3142 domain-containing protein n=1 Tax=Caenimonas terrae TaxID=696074 RepID=A0ABW0N634_9BURK